MSQSESVTFFLDRALGKSIGQALQQLGKQVEFHNDHFAPDSLDTQWLPIVSEQNWVVLTKDENIGRNALEVQSVAQFNARVFGLVSGSLSRQKMIDIFSNSIQAIEKIIQGNQAPFIAKIYQNATVTIWKNRNQLKKKIKNS